MAFASLWAKVAKVQDTFEVVVKLFEIFVFFLWADLPSGEIKLVLISNECSVEGYTEKLFVFATTSLILEYDHHISFQAEVLGQIDHNLLLFW